MTLTHVSHFGLTQIGMTSDNILLEGTLGNCKRMAHAHGLEVVREEGRILSSICGNAIHDMTNIVRLVLNRGMIQKTPTGWVLVMNLVDWNQGV